VACDASHAGPAAGKEARKEEEQSKAPTRQTDNTVTSGNELKVSSEVQTGFRGKLQDSTGADRKFLDDDECV